MNKNELLKKVADKCGVTSSFASSAVNAVFDTIAEAIGNEEPVKIVNFGVFEVRTRPARNARNPKTGEAVHVPERKKIEFRAGSNLWKLLEEPSEDRSNEPRF